MNPTQEQINLVNDIASALEIEFPTNSRHFTQQNYANFIETYQDCYYQLMNENLDYYGLTEYDVLDECY